MTDIYLNTNHDVVLDGRDLRLTTEDEDLVQRLTIKLQFLLNEWFLDTSKGLPYTQLIFEEGVNNLERLQSIFRTEIINTEGVEKINSLDLSIDRDEKTLTIKLQVNQTVNVEVTI